MPKFLSLAACDDYNFSNDFGDCIFVRAYQGGVGMHACYAVAGLLQKKAEIQQQRGHFLRSCFCWMIVSRALVEVVVRC